MAEISGVPSASLAFLWPALAAASASNFASALAKEFVNLAVGSDAASVCPEPEWATCNKVALELDSVRLRDFAATGKGMPTLICAPFALHGATVVDFAPGHSLVTALQTAGLRRVFATEWRSASPAMSFMSIDGYLADLNVLVDQLGGKVDLIGLCQGGWMALIYAARFPSKVGKLVLAGAPIDLAAGQSALSQLARDVPMPVFEQLVHLGDGRILGHRVLQFWEPTLLTPDLVHKVLQCAHAIASPQFRALEAQFRVWHAWTVDLPGVYYLQVVERIFKENQIATGRFVALGQPIDLKRVQIPLFLLAAQHDDLVAAEQVFATEHLVGTAARHLRKAMAPGEHLSLFMGERNLLTTWREIAHWLAVPDISRKARRPPVESMTSVRTRAS
ncbi:MAG: alpha/beta fold hydrolase [Xanthobacteraceae bacterium]